MALKVPAPRNPASPTSPGRPYHGAHVSDLPFFSRGSWQPLWNERARLEHTVGAGTEMSPPNPDTHLRAWGAVHPREASDSVVAFLPKEAWGSAASLSSISSLGRDKGQDWGQGLESGFSLGRVRTQFGAGVRLG